MTRHLVIALAAALSARYVIAFDTPIDRALPFCAVVIVVAAFVAQREAILTAIPLLFAIEIAADDERLRLLAIGVVVASAIAAAAILCHSERSEESPAALAMTRWRFITLGVLATLLMRWIPLQSVEPLKEVIVLAGVVALLATMKSRSPLSLAIAIGIALATPTHPGRMVFYPAGVAMTQLLAPWPLAFAAVLLVAAIVSRYSLAAIYALAAAALLAPLAARRSPLATRVVLVISALVLALWPWSGLTARLLPLPVAATALAAIVALALSGRVATIAGTALIAFMPLMAMPNSASTDTTAALESSQSLDVELPRNVRRVVLKISGANMTHMRPGRVVGAIEARDVRGGATRRELRIGDVADFGFMRREQFFFSRNVPARNASGDPRGYGAASFLYGAGRIPISFNAAPLSLRVVAANDLPAGSKLQVDAVEYRTE